MQGLKQYKDYCIESELSTGDKTLSFLYPTDLSKEIKEEGYIRNKTDEFVIKEVSTKGNWKSIKAKLNVEDLEGKVFESFDTTNETITDCINLALAGTGWIVGTCDVTKRRTVRKTNSSSWEIIQEARKVYRCELEFDTLNKIINIYEKRGNDKGVYFLDSLNLKDLSIQSDSYDFYTRIIAKGKDDLKVTLENFQYSNKVKTYIWKDERYTDIDSLTEDAKTKLNDLSKPYRSYSATVIDLANISEEYKNILSYSLGDVITLISKENGIKEKQRIVKMVEYPDEPDRNTCEIANTTLSFEDIQKEFQDTTETVNNITTDNGTIDGSTIDGISTEQIYEFEASVAKITDLTVLNAKIDDLYANKANISELNTVIANVAELNTTKANITDLKAINANIEKLIAADATINNALIGKADITELNAVQGNITSLNSQVANIQTLVNGNLSSENIQTGGITSDKLTIANGFITNAMIASLDVDKINAGDFSTTKFRIVSDSGNMLISDNTIQITDKNRVRVQIGKDASNDYNMYVWDSAGKLMFDATGLKADGIKNKIIRDDMISDTANITGSKINISSLITEINKDTNTSVIKSSKVQLDTVGQTLEVAFNSLKSNVDNMEIGGTNLATETNKGVTGWGWSLQTGGKTISEVIENGIRCCKMVRDSVTSTGWSYINYNKIGRTKYLAGRKYTVSFEVKSSVPTTFYCSFLEGNSTNGMNTATAKATVSEADKWTKLTFTVTMKDTLPSSTAQILYLNGMDSGTGVTYIFRNLIIEEGTKASNWSPSPEDIDSSIESVKQITESNSTTINVMQGQIATAINNTQIVKDGQTILLKDDYNRTVTLVNSINSTIGTHATKINELTGSITSVDTKVNSVQRDLEGTKSTVSSHSTSISDLSSKVSTQGSSISQLQTQIALKVEQTDITNAINNINIGTENLIKGSKDFTIGSTRDKGFINSGSYSISKDSDGFSIATKSQSGLTSNNIPSLYSSYVTCSSGDTFTVSVWFKVKDVNAWDVKRPLIFEGYDSAGTRVQYEDVDITNSKSNKPIVANDEWCYITYTNSITNSSVVKMGVRLTLFRNGEISFKKLKIEKGNKATDWSPAYEDIESSIDTVNSKVTTTSNKVATIETNLNSITQRVSSTESTVSTHTTQLGTVDSRINTAKSSAISIASSDATTKANNALSSAKSYTDGQITTVNQTITNKVAEIKTTTDSITQRVSSTESRITTITTDFNNLQIGGRNLMLNSAPKTLGGSWAGTSGSITLVDENTAPYGKSFKATYSATGTNGGMYKTPKSKLTVGEKYSWSVWVKASKSITMTIGLEQGGTKTCSVTTSWQRFTHTFTAINNTNYAFVIYTSGTTVNSGDYYLVHSIMVEEATKPSSWNSAPEDINSDIITVDTKITTTNNKVAIIETNLSSITSRVSSTESSITTINGNVTSLQSRMTTAEQKITPTAITTTISSVITGGTGSISTTQFVMDKTGFTINNGALKVKNKAGTTVLEGDSNGNLILKNGCFKVLASNNSEIASIDQNNWMRVQGLHVFGLGQCMQNKGTGVRSLIIESTDGNAAHIDFNYGNSSLDYGVRLIREGSGSRMLKLLGSGLTVQNPSSNSNCDIELRSNGGPTYIDFSHDIHADYETRIITYQGDSKLHIVGGLVVDSGTKSAMQTTENYGNRLMYAVEACENYFEDIYNCQLVDGKCIVEMDKIFLECVNTKDYDYFLIIDELEECEGLFAPKELRSWDSFTVKEKHNGNSNIEFNVIVRAKRKDFENIRLEEMKSQPETNHLSKIN